MLEWLHFILTSLLLLLGLFVLSIGVIAQFRFHYVLNRMHAASMGDSLGLMLIALGLCISCTEWPLLLKMLLTAFFLWVSSPTASHLIARLETTVNTHLEKEMEVRRL